MADTTVKVSTVKKRMSIGLMFALVLAAVLIGALLTGALPTGVMGVLAGIGMVLLVIEDIRKSRAAAKV